MSRKPVPAWTEQVPCATCQKPRAVTANHRWYFEKAATKSCRPCGGRRTSTINASRQGFVKSQTLPFARNYVPDEEVVDWVVVDRLMSGQQVNSTRPERVAAVAALTALGMPCRAIAERMHITQRSAERLRRTIREEVAA